MFCTFICSLHICTTKHSFIFHPSICLCCLEFFPVHWFGTGVEQEILQRLFMLCIPFPPWEKGQQAKLSSRKMRQAAQSSTADAAAKSEHPFLRKKERKKQLWLTKRKKKETVLPFWDLKRTSILQFHLANILPWCLRSVKRHPEQHIEECVVGNRAYPDYKRTQTAKDEMNPVFLCYIFKLKTLLSAYWWEWRVLVEKTNGEAVVVIIVWRAIVSSTQWKQSEVRARKESQLKLWRDAAFQICQSWPRWADCVTYCKTSSCVPLRPYPLLAIYLSIMYTERQLLFRASDRWSLAPA